MKSPIVNYVIALGVAGLAALGGGLAVFSSYDDAPGGVLLGIFLVLGAVALNVRAVQRGG